MLELFEPAFDFTIRTEARPMMLALVSDGCGHCAAMKPTLAALAARYERRVPTWYVTVDRAPGLGSVFARDGVPVLMGWLGGRPVYRTLGAPAPDVLAEMYEDLARLRTGAARTWSQVSGPFSGIAIGRP